MFPSTAIISGRVVELLVDRGEVLVEEERAVSSQDQMLESILVLMQLLAISTRYEQVQTGFCLALRP